MLVQRGLDFTGRLFPNREVLESVLDPLLELMSWISEIENETVTGRLFPNREVLGSVLDPLLGVMS